MSPAAITSRDRANLIQDAGPDANELLWTLRRNGIDAPAVLTVGWTRRHLIDVALELAAQQLDRAEPSSTPKRRAGNPTASINVGRTVTSCLSEEKVERPSHYFRKSHGVWTCVDCGATS